MIKAVIFDLDGTLLNTLGDLQAAVNTALTQKGYPKKTLEEVRSFLGNGIKNLVARSLPEKELLKKDPETETAELLDAFSEYYKTHLFTYTVPYEGILPLLDTLKQKGVKIAVASNKKTELAIPLCHRFFGEKTDFVIGETEGMPRKPDPAMVNVILSSLQLRKEDCLYVGDSDVDVKTAKNCGITSVSVAWGFRTEEQLRSAGASEIIYTPEELLGFLENR